MQYNDVPTSAFGMRFGHGLTYGNRMPDDVTAGGGWMSNQPHLILTTIPCPPPQSAPPGTQNLSWFKAQARITFGPGQGIVFESNPYVLQNVPMLHAVEGGSYPTAPVHFSPIYGAMGSLKVSKGNFVYFNINDHTSWTFAPADGFQSLYLPIRRVGRGGQLINIKLTGWGDPDVVKITNPNDDPSETLRYVYDDTELLHSCTLLRTVGGVTTPVRRALYTWYQEGDLHGNPGDLKTVTRQVYSGGRWVGKDTRYCRYYLAGESGGYQHGLKYLLEPQAFADFRADHAVADPFTASDEIVAQYADYYFEYDYLQRATLETVSGGLATYTYAYFDNPQSGSEWMRKTVEQLPNGTQNIVYTNNLGQVVLMDHAGQVNYRRFDERGRAIFEAEPTAVQSYSEGSQDLGVVLNTQDGLVRTYDYAEVADGSGSTTMAVSVQQGSSGAPILQRATVTLQQTAPNGQVIRVPAQRTLQADEQGQQPLPTTLAYQYWPKTCQPQSRVATLPVVSTDQNGPGTAATVQQAYDIFGRTNWSMDERGFITYRQRDPTTGAVTQLIRDVDGSQLAFPSGWSTPAGGGLHLVSDFQIDPLGRVTQALGPEHTAIVSTDGTQAATVRSATWTVYDDAHHEVRSAQGYLDRVDGSYTLVNPVTIIKRDAAGRQIQSIQAVRSSTAGPLTAADVFPQSSYCRWTVNSYANNRLRWARVYHTIPAEGTGLRGVNYDQTDYGYDFAGRQNRVKSPGGTITRTLFDSFDNAVAIYVGTNDKGATDADPTGGGIRPNNMVLVTENEYDAGCCRGSGNLTQVTQWVDANTSRVTNYGYDWQNRRVVVEGEEGFYQKLYYDNLGNNIRTEQYDGGPTGNLIALSETAYDALGRVYQQTTYGVDPATGAIGNALTANTWYDLAGNVIKQQPAGSQGFTKTAYDSLGRVVATYSAFNTAETTWEDASSVADDTILQQTENLYDAAGNLVAVTNRARVHTATDDQLGELQTLTGADPKARVSYLAIYYDGIGRTIAMADYGTHGNSELERPDDVPRSCETLLISSLAYNDRGESFSATNPAGRESQTQFDDAGRTVVQIQNYVTGTADPATPDQDVTVLYSYTPDGNLATLTAVNGGTGNQVTQYAYGTTLSDSSVARSDLLRAVIYPDSDNTAKPLGNGPSGVYDRVEYTYNRQSQIVTGEDQNATAHTYSYDGLGRQVQDCVVALGTGVDSAVFRIAQAYEVRGLLQGLTSYDSASIGSGNVVNDVRLVYNSFGQLVADYQEHEGAVSTATTPSVGYTYADGSAGTVRRAGVVYPNGRVVNYQYADGIDDAFDRITAIVDGDSASAPPLAQYARLGVNQFVQVDSPEPSLRYDLAFGTGDDPYAGVDQFGRIVDLRWWNPSTGQDVERIQHGYDLAGNRLWRQNPVAAAMGMNVDELYTYDGVNQLKTFARGQLASGQSAIAADTETFAQDWSLDPTGNWSELQQDSDGSGDWDLDQPRTHNAVNEITAFGATAGPQWASPAYDLAGNMTGLPQPASPGDGFVCTYDAWNRLVTVANATSGETVARYQYDGRGYRTVAQTFASGVLNEARNFYYSDQWQVLEEAPAGCARIGNSYGACVTWTTWCFVTATPPAMARSTSGSTPCKTRTGTSRRSSPHPPVLPPSVINTRPTANRRSSRECLPGAPRPCTRPTPSIAATVGMRLPNHTWFATAPFGPTSAAGIAEIRSRTFPRSGTSEFGGSIAMRTMPMPVAVR